MGGETTTRATIFEDRQAVLKADIARPKADIYRASRIQGGIAAALAGPPVIAGVVATSFA